MSKQQFFVPTHNGRADAKSFYHLVEEDVDAEDDNRMGTEESESLFDDDESDLAYRKVRDLKRKSLETPAEPNFSDYIHQQINSYFDHTNVSNGSGSITASTGKSAYQAASQVKHKSSDLFKVAISNA